MELRVRPKSDYLHNASFDELHKVTLEWVSELNLWKDELQFFQRLIDKFIMKMITQETLTHVQEIVDRIIHYNDIDLKDILSKVELHEKHLEQLVEQPFSHDETAFRKEHSELEDEISKFMGRFKNFKTEIFEVIEELLRNEKLQHLLQS